MLGHPSSKQRSALEILLIIPLMIVSAMKMDGNHSRSVIPAEAGIQSPAPCRP